MVRMKQHPGLVSEMLTGEDREKLCRDAKLWADRGLHEDDVDSRPYRMARMRFSVEFDADKLVRRRGLGYL